MTRCQICGRRKGLRKDGGIAHHHLKGAPCLGIGHPPIEQDDARLAEVVRETRARSYALNRQLCELFDRRANYIDPALKAELLAASLFASKLERRLARHRNWPVRFRREMERDGWGSPPPKYLLDRKSLAE